MTTRRKFVEAGNLTQPARRWRLAQCSTLQAWNIHVCVGDSVLSNLSTSLRACLRSGSGKITR